MTEEEYERGYTRARWASRWVLFERILLLGLELVIIGLMISHLIFRGELKDVEFLILGYLFCRAMRGSFDGR